MRGRHPAARGFTLIDLLLVLTLVGVILTLSDAFSSLLGRNRATTAINRVIGSVHLARSEAIKRGTTVSMCPDAGASCGSSWSAGIIIFSDHNGNGQLDNDEELLHRLETSGGHGRLEWKAFPNSSFIGFAPRGFTLNQNGSFTYCPNDNNNKNARQVIISQTGRPRLAMDMNNDGIVENSSGQNISCM